MFTHHASIIISIIPGMWVQKSQGTEKFAVLFPFRPFDSHTREPLLHCVTITDELAVDSAKYNVVDIKALDLSKVGNIRNDKLKAVMATMEEELKDSLLFHKHYPVDNTDKSLSCAFEAANQQIKKEDKKTNTITALRDFRRAVVRDKDSNVFGVRFKGTKLPWKALIPAAEKGKPADIVWKEETCTKQQEEYDLFVVDLFIRCYRR